MRAAAAGGVPAERGPQAGSAPPMGARPPRAPLTASMRQRLQAAQRSRGKVLPPRRDDSAWGGEGGGGPTRRTLDTPAARAWYLLSWLRVPALVLSLIALVACAAAAARPERPFGGARVDVLLAHFDRARALAASAPRYASCECVRAVRVQWGDPTKAGAPAEALARELNVLARQALPVAAAPRRAGGRGVPAAGEGESVLESRGRNDRSPAPVYVSVARADSLNERFRAPARAAFSTDGVTGVPPPLLSPIVLSVDDDVLLSCADVCVGAEAAQSFGGQQMVGYYPRLVTHAPLGGVESGAGAPGLRARWAMPDDPGVGGEARATSPASASASETRADSTPALYRGWLRGVWWSGEYNEVLTKAAFLRTEWLDAYFSEAMTAARGIVDEHMNCEDIAMSYVAHARAPARSSRVARSRALIDPRL